MNAPCLADQPKAIRLSFGIAAVLATFLNAVSARAEQSLTFTETIQLATQNQPLLQSLDDAAAASRQAAIAEGQLSDPKVKFGVINLPVTKSDSLRFDRDDQTMANLGIAQDVTPRKKREVASSRLLAEADQFHSAHIATARTIERDVALAWLDVYEAQRKAELYQRMIEEMLAERKVQVASVSAGTSKTSDVLRMDRQVSVTNEKRIMALRDERKARAALARWIGSAASRPISPELPDSSDHFNQNAIQAELDQHPLLLNAAQSEKVAQLDLDSAQASLERNWGWEVGYGKRFADRSDMLTLQISMDLQLDRANRQDRRTAEKLMLLEKARKLTEDRRHELSAELESAMADAEAAEARENEHLTKLIPNAEARLNIARAAYQSGKQPLSDVWDARRDVLEVELDHWAILTDKQRAIVKIGYLLNDRRLFKQIEKE